MELHLSINCLLSLHCIIFNLLYSSVYLRRCLVKGQRKYSSRLRLFFSLIITITSLFEYILHGRNWLNIFHLIISLSSSSPYKTCVIFNSIFVKKTDTRMFIYPTTNIKSQVLTNMYESVHDLWTQWKPLSLLTPGLEPQKVNKTHLWSILNWTTIIYPPIY